MNENTFLNLGNNNQASQPMDMNPMGGDAYSMPMGDPNMMGGDPAMAGGDPNMMGGDPAMAGGDPNMMGGDPNEPVMGADAFDGQSDADVSGDPEKKAESLAGQLASIFRKDLANDGINKHEDKKKEILGMITSAIVDGMDEEDRNSMIEYLSDKLNGSGESKGDDENLDNGAEESGEAINPGTMPESGMDNNNTQPQQMMEKRINEVVGKIIKEITGNDLTRKRMKTKETKVDQPERKGYKSYPYRVKNN